MDERDWLAERFEEHRPHLRAVAYRMLSSASEAEDAVQEAWLRLSRSDSSRLRNLGGWLTTVVARVCLNMLQSRRLRREEPAGEDLPDLATATDPAQETVRADAVGAAMLVVLETLTPAERIAFVLHDMFGVPFEEIAPVVDRTPTAARQLASRARRRVRGAEPPETDRSRQREIVKAFLAASRGGDFEALVALLDPDAVFRADAAAVRMGAEHEARGAAAVASTFAGRARAARLALIDGLAGVVWSQGGRPRAAFTFAVDDGRITAIDLLAEPDRLDELDVELVRD